jgi:hypothetical protein
MKNKNNKKKVSTAVKHDHPGRPQYSLRHPTRKEFTFMDILKANGVDTDKVTAGGKVNPNYGKSDNCSLLTIRKSLERDMYFHTTGKRAIAANRTRVNPRSEFCIVAGVTAEPDSASGLGRRALVYCLRVNKGNVSKPTAKTDAPAKVASAPKATRKPRTPKTSASTSQTPTADALDKIHRALMAPDTATAPETKAPEALTVEAVKIVPPVAPETVKAPETPAPVESAPEVAPEAAAAAPAEVPAPAATLANS